MGGRIADRIAAYMREHDLGALCWGDGHLANAARPWLRGKAGAHPLNAMTAGCNAMERAPDLFRKTLIRAADSAGNSRVVRCFWLREREADK